MRHARVYGFGLLGRIGVECVFVMIGLSKSFAKSFDPILKKGLLLVAIAHFLSHNHFRGSMIHIDNFHGE